MTCTQPHDFSFAWIKFLPQPSKQSFQALGLRRESHFWLLIQREEEMGVISAYWWQPTPNLLTSSTRGCIEMFKQHQGQGQLPHRPRAIQKTPCPQRIPSGCAPGAMRQAKIRQCHKSQGSPNCGPKLSGASHQMLQKDPTRSGTAELPWSNCSCPSSRRATMAAFVPKPVLKLVWNELSAEVSP